MPYRSPEYKEKEKSDFWKSVDIKTISFLEGLKGFFEALAGAFRDDEVFYDVKKALPEDLQEHAKRIEKRQVRRADGEVIKFADIQDGLKYLEKETGISLNGPNNGGNLDIALEALDKKIADAKAHNNALIEERAKELEAEAIRQAEIARQEELAALRANSAVTKSEDGSAVRVEARIKISDATEDGKKAKFKMASMSIENHAPLSLIIDKESGGDHNILNGNIHLSDVKRKYGISGYEGKKLEDLTVSQVLELQEKILAAEGQTALGLVQVKHSTLKDAVKKLGIKGDAKFSKALQVKIGIYLFEKRGWQTFLDSDRRDEDIRKFIEGTQYNKDKKMMEGGIYSEWAVLKGSKGKGNYDGFNGNGATIEYQDMVDAVLNLAHWHDTGLVRHPGTLQAPVSFLDDHITSRYGPRTIKKKANFHQGLDAGVPVGTPFYAIDGGVVSHVNDTRQDNHGMGGVCGVVHGDINKDDKVIRPVFSNYMHNSKILIKKGETVAQGEQLGRTGNTGFSTGPHLDIKIIIFGTHPKTGKVTAFTVPPVKAGMLGDKIYDPVAQQQLIDETYKQYGEKSVAKAYYLNCFDKSHFPQDYGKTPALDSIGYNEDIRPQNEGLTPQFDEAAGSEGLSYTPILDGSRTLSGDIRNEFGVNYENLIGSTWSTDEARPKRDKAFESSVAT